jgi:hypothetical protein
MYIILLKQKTMIRSQEHVRSIDVGHFLDDLVQFFERLLHGIERFASVLAESPILSIMLWKM